MYMKKTYLRFSSVLFIITGLFSCFAGFSQPDTSTIKIDTSEYISGDIHFNLILAADKGYDKEVLRLLNEGAFINSRTDDGVTPLMYAVENQHTQVVKILLLNGANPDLKDFNGVPALIPAIEKGDPEIVEMLIRKGADINITDDKNRTALMHAVRYGDVLLVDMLIYYNANTNLRDHEGNTAIHFAAFQGNLELVKLLAGNNAMIDKSNNEGFTPLHYSCQEGHLEVGEYLLAQGANISAKTRAGYTPLALAVLKNRYNVTSLLIEKGADVNEKAAIATSPMNIAKSNKNDSIADLLKAHGARMFRRPAFQYYSIDFDMSFSPDDIFMGGGLGLHDTRYGLSATIGIDSRLSAKPVLAEAEESDTFYQYWERRTLTYLGLYKRFKLFNLDNSSSGGLYAGGHLVYSFGKYRGTIAKPDPRIMISPAAGAYLQLRHVLFTLGYEYIDFKTHKISPSRIKIGMNFLIPGKGMKQAASNSLWHN